MQHRGKIVESIVRTSGLSFSTLAVRMGISRNTLYNRFKEKNLSYEFIVNLGKILHYNLASHFPEMQSEGAFVTDSSAKIFEVKMKSQLLLQKYNCLLHFLLKKSQDANLPDLYNEVKKFIKSPS